MILKENFFIITGGPGVGKTTLLDELRSRGFRYIPEAARNIIKTQMESDGDALPWKNKEKYSSFMLERSVAAYISASTRGQKDILFFDRGIPDTLAYCKLANITDPEGLAQAVRHYRYGKKVFILPPWEDIYRTDTERKQTFEEATETFRVMRKTYQELNYNLVTVPKLQVTQRADFVLKNLIPALI